MLAGVSYKNEYDKVIPKAETNQIIKELPNIGIRSITRIKHGATPPPHRVALHWRYTWTKPPLKELPTVKKKIFINTNVKT